MSVAAAGMAQLALPLDWPAGGDMADYLVSAANRPVVDHLLRWREWPVMAVLVAGPRKSGRSLLGRGFSAASGGELADDAEAHGEEALFHAWNRAQAARRPLVLVAAQPPPAWEVRLPDLRSRLLATPALRIAEPDEALVAALLAKLCHDRGLPAPPELVRYLTARIDRTYLAVHRTMEALDELSFRHRRPLTVPLAREALLATGVIDASRVLG